MRSYMHICPPSAFDQMLNIPHLLGLELFNRNSLNALPGISAEVCAPFFRLISPFFQRFDTDCLTAENPKELDPKNGLIVNIFMNSW